MLMRAELARARGCSSSPTSSTTSSSPCTARSCCCSSRPPLFVGFANVVMPLQIGAPDVAFPRLNALRLLVRSCSAPLIAARGFLTPHGAAAFGWFAYAPLNSAVYSPGHRRATCGSMGLVLSGLGTILGAVNFITTIICLRAPGMTMFRMPIFTWNVLVTADPGAAGLPGARRRAASPWRPTGSFGAHVFDAANGGALLWQHLFWFFGHPEVYIIALAVLRHHHARSSRSSAASRSSATRAWSARPSRSPRCR